MTEACKICGAADVQNHPAPCIPKSATRVWQVRRNMEDLPSRADLAGPDVNWCWDAPPLELVPKEDLDKLLQAAKQWRNATESRLKLLDSRGEAARAMLKADRDLIAVIEGLEGER